MPKEFVYVTFEIPAEQHRQLQIVAIERGCTQKALLQASVDEYLQKVAGKAGQI